MPQNNASDITLYNGIIIPKDWPPRDRTFSREPIGTPPYIISPPEVINIDIGRQLFVDDFLIQETTLDRTFHKAEYHPASPVVKPDKAWEMPDEDTPEKGRHSPTAMVNSGGVWYDPQDGLYKMWYMGGYQGYLCYATSRDGVHWEKPLLDIVPGTNVVYAPKEGRIGSTSVVLDLEETDPNRRYKLFIGSKGVGRNWFYVYFSPDGINWGERVAETGVLGDTTTVFRNPFRNVWIYSIKDPHLPGQAEVYIVPGTNERQHVKRRWYYECTDLIKESKWDWESGRVVRWVCADKLDPMRPDLNIQTMLYRLNCVAYESVILGLFDIWYGEPPDRIKPNNVVAGFSRDGFHWDRTNREPLFGVSENYGDWNWGDVQPAEGCCLVIGDKLYFYAQGRAGVKGTKLSGVCSTGLAILRRDGFASMDAGTTQGTLTTRTVKFGGKHLFVNVDCPNGQLSAELLDNAGQVIPPFSRENCIPVSADETLQAVTWNGVQDLSSLSGKPIKFRFYLTNGKLYSFWVSPDKNGASHGYVAAGGPGFDGPTDTVGDKINSDSP